MTKGEIVRLICAGLLLLFGVIFWVGQQCFNAAWARNPTAGYSGRVLTTDALAVGRAEPARVIAEGLRREPTSLHAWGLAAVWIVSALFLARRTSFRVAKWGVIIGALASLNTPFGLLMSVPTVLEFLRAREMSFLLGEEVVEEVLRCTAVGLVWLGGLVLFGVREDR
ncbi:MAG: hypothetical protein ABIU54_11645 [Candidatus Eisenbacteria bacterium]